MADKSLKQAAAMVFCFLGFALSAPAFGQAGVQFDSNTLMLLACPATIERAPSARNGERVAYRKLEVRPLPGWTPMIVGGNVYCEEFWGQDAKGVANLRQLAEHGQVQGVEYKVDYHSTFFYVSRGATGLKQVTISNEASKGGLWRLHCGLVMGNQHCSLDTLEGVSVDISGQPLKPRLSVNPLVVAKGDVEIQWPATVRSGTAAPVQLTQFGAMPDTFLTTAVTNGYVEVIVKQRPKGSSGAFTDVTRRVEIRNFPVALAMLQAILAAQSRR